MTGTTPCTDLHSGTLKVAVIAIVRESFEHETKGQILWHHARQDSPHRVVRREMAHLFGGENLPHVTRFVDEQPVHRLWGVMSEVAGERPELVEIGGVVLGQL